MRFALRSLLALMLLALVACTGKSSERTQHDGPIPTTYGGPRMTSQEADQAVLQAYNKSGRADQVINNKSSSSAQVLSESQTLAETVLNRSVLEQPEMSGTPEFRSLLATLNRGIVRLIDQDPETLRRSGLLKNYYAMAFDGCDEDLKSCTKLYLFKDSLSARVLTFMAREFEIEIKKDRAERTRLAEQINAKKCDCQNELKQVNQRYFSNVFSFYRLLFAAFDISTFRTNPDLNMTYLRLSQDYFAYLRSLPAEKRTSDFHRRHAQNMNIILNRVRDEMKTTNDRAEYCQFVIDTNPLSFQLDSGDQGFDRKTMRFFVSEFIECSSLQKDQRLLQKAIGDLLSKESQILQAEQKQAAQDAAKNSTEKADWLYSVSDKGFSYTLAELATDREIARGLNVDLNAKADPIVMFVADRLFYGRIDQSMARAYWDKLENRFDPQILAYFTNYARAQMAYEIKTTLQNYGLILRQEFKKRDGLGTGFYDEVLKRINNMQSGWELLKAHQRNLRDFLLRAYDQKSLDPRFAAAITKALDELDSVSDKTVFAELKDMIQPAKYDHVGLTVVAPMTMALYYYMAKSQGTIKIFVPWWPMNDQYFTINAQNSLRQYLQSDGRIDFQLINLGSDMYKFDHMGKLHAMNFALRTGLFKYIPFDLLDEDREAKPFAVDQTEANNQYLFFRQAFKDIFRFWETYFQSATKSIDDVLRDRNFTERFLNACRDPLGATVTMKLDKLRKGTLFEEEHLFTAVNEIYSTGRFMSGWREDRQGIMNYIKVVEAHAERARSETGREVVSRLKADLARYEGLERLFYKKLFALDRKIVDSKNDCLMTLQKAEYFRRDVIYKQNIEYYKTVHAAALFLKLVDGQTPEMALNSAGSVIGHWLSEKSRGASAAQIAVHQDVARRMNALTQTLRTVGLSALRSATSLEEGVNRLLNIHNFDNEPFMSQRLGLFVTGVPTYSSSNPGREIKALNYVTKDRFVQSRWDSLARIRQQLQTTWVNAREANQELGTSYTSDFIVGRRMDIPLGSWADLDNDGMYNNNETFKVSMDEDQSDFVKQAMIQLAGYKGGSGVQFIDWNSNAGLGMNLFEKRFGWMRELAQFGSIQTDESDAKNCPHDEFNEVLATRDLYGNALFAADARTSECRAVRITPKNILDSFIRLGQALNLSDFDRELLEWIDRSGKNSGLVLEYFKYDKEPSTSKWTWFDEFYREKLVSETVYAADGTKSSIETLRGKDEFKNYIDSYLHNVRSAKHLFALESAPTQVERDAVRKQIVRHMDEIREYEALIRRIEDSGQKLGEIVFERVNPDSRRSDEKYIDGVWRYMPIRYRTSGERAGTPIYLEDNERVKAWYASVVQHFFVNESLCEALPKKADPDAARYSPVLDRVSDETLSCEKRFQIWKNASNGSR